jgi:hypothetical protein
MKIRLESEMENGTLYNIFTFRCSYAASRKIVSSRSDVVIEFFKLT